MARRGTKSPGEAQGSLGRASMETSGTARGALHRRALPVNHDSSLLGAASRSRVPCGLARHPQPPSPGPSEPAPHAVRQPREGAARRSAARDCHTMGAREPRGAEPALVDWRSPEATERDACRPDCPRSVPLACHPEPTMPEGPWRPSRDASKCLRFNVSSYWHSCCSSDTRARGRRQKRHGGPVCDESRGSVSGQDSCRR